MSSSSRAYLAREFFFDLVEADRRKLEGDAMVTITK